MAKKTNKTSHVMDLLTNGASLETDEPVHEAPAAQEKKNADIQSHTVTPAKVTIVDEGSRNDRLSQEILGKLTQELEDEARQEAQTNKAAQQKAGQKEDTASLGTESVNAADDQETDPMETVGQENDPIESVGQEANPIESVGQEIDPIESADPSPDVPNETVLPDADSPDTSEAAASQESDVNEVREPEPGPEVLSQQTVGKSSEDATQPSPDASQSQADSRQENGKAKKVGGSPKAKPHPIIPESQLDNRFMDKEYRFINVMEQLLMRQNLESVLAQYDVCTCPRCMSDVCALVLTGLPAKYVVTSHDSISPLISYYENKYKIPILTELMKACDKVRQNPRHKVS